MMKIIEGTENNLNSEENFHRWIDMNKARELSKENYGSPRISSEYSDCSLPNTFDQYSMCGNACSYCFAFQQKSNNPVFDMCGNTKATNFKKFKEEFLGEGNKKNSVRYKSFYSKRKVLQWGSMADPFDSVFENKFHNGEEYIKLFNETKYPIRFCSKFYPSKRLIDLFESNKENKNYAFMYSIVTDNPEHAKEIEYGANSPDKRFEAMKLFSDMGYYTMWRLRPFIMGTSDKTLDSMMEKALNSGVNAISTEWFCVESRANPTIKKMFNFISKSVGFDYVKYSKALSPSCRGGYLRLNRDVKEPYIRKMYLWAKENGVHFAVSDPDFKELNDSGSCCGLPSVEQNTKWHPDLSNYCRGQWTEMLVKARKNFWKKNTVEDVIKGDYEDEKLYFDQQITHPDAEWMHSGALINETIEKTSLNTGETSNTTYVLLARKTWNSIDSPKGLNNYFHGKVTPCGYDENDNIVYKYVPMPYEILWQKEFGINLSK